MGNLSSLVQGLSQGLNGYLQANQQQQRQQQNDAFQNQLKLQDMQTQSDLSVQANKQTLENQKNMDPMITADMAKTMFSTVSPDFGDAAYKTVMQAGGQVHAQDAEKMLDPIMKAISAKAMKDATDADKASKEQDKLEKDFQDRMVNVRGDQSILRAENQRSAASSAYETLMKARSEGRNLSNVEYADLLGQVWQARTGKAPTDQDMQHMRDDTAKGNFNKWVLWATGDPNKVGATTTATEDNLLQFITDTGNKADQQWSGFVQPRINPPTGLNKDRVEHVLSAHRGLSFADQKAVSDKTYSKPKTDFSGFKIIKRS